MEQIKKLFHFLIMLFYIFVFFLRVFAYTPFFIFYTISSIVSLILVFVPQIRKVPYRNFYRVFPHYSSFKLWILTYKYFVSFSDYLFETYKMSIMNEKAIRKHCIFKNTEILEKLIEKHQFIICYCGHVLNYEFFTSLPLHTKDIGMCHLYLAAPPSKGLDLMLKLRSKYGAINIPSNNPLRILLKLKKELDEGNSKYKGYVFGTLSDMDPKQDDKHSVPFLDHKLEVKTGAEKIARKMNMAFCYAHFSRIKRGFYEVEFKEIKPQTDPIIDEFAYTDEFVRLFEKNILEKPELWMQWGAPRF